MNKIVVDDELRKKLHNLTESLELCDEQGHVLGYVTPVGDKSLYDQVQSPLSEEELQKRLKEEGGRPLEEILRDLENKA
jgi:hypothetical protein